MNRKIALTYIILCATFIMSAQNIKTKIEPIFTNTLINFDPSAKPDGVNNIDSIVYIGNGRIVLKKVRLPKFTHSTNLNVKTTLVSNGDPWDKSGSCFVIPKKPAINMIQIADNKATYPYQDTTLFENLAGIVQGENYKPTVEIMRFMTPFGVGHFSADDNELSAKRKPVYIDGWAENVVWQEEITDLLPLFEDEVYVGIFIDTWTPEGYVIDLELTYTESDLPCDIKPTMQLNR